MIFEKPPGDPDHGRLSVLRGEFISFDRRPKGKVDLGPDAAREKHLSGNLQKFGQLLAFWLAFPDFNEEIIPESGQQDAAGNGHLQLGVGDAMEHDVEAARPILKGGRRARADFRIGLHLDMGENEKGAPAFKMVDRGLEGLHTPGGVVRREDEVPSAGRKRP